MEIDKSTQGTLEEQMFYNRRTLQELTTMRHDDPTNQVMHHSHPNIWVSNILFEEPTIRIEWFLL